MAWSWVQTVIVAGSPDSDLVKVLQHQQSQGDFGGGAPRTPNWVWLSQSDQAEAIASQPWQQITLTAPARGQLGPLCGTLSSALAACPWPAEASAYDTARVLASLMEISLNRWPGLIRMRNRRPCVTPCANVRLERR